MEALVQVELGLLAELLHLKNTHMVSESNQQQQVGHVHPEVPAGPRLTGPEEWLGGPCPALLVQVTRKLKVPPGGRSVTL